jgi:phenylalanyl-tRNA synthetase alpha chain
MIDKLRQLQQVGSEEIAAADTPETLEQARIKYLGRKSELNQVLKQLGGMEPQRRREVSELANRIKRQFAEQIEARKEPVAEAALDARLDAERVDVTLPGRPRRRGHLHPITQVIRQMNDIFARMGFAVLEGPEIETDQHNFEMLNIPKDHPSRDLQDTLFIDYPEIILRTHTSSMEIHAMLNLKPPIRVVVPGKSFRYETVNPLNNYVFYQYEGLAVGRDITLAHLKGTLDTFVRAIFGTKHRTRFRCKYYPQVEPGVGVDMDCSFCRSTGCPTCKYRGWIEMLGAGMVHPNVLRNVGLDPDVYSGFAFGMGLDRIVMSRFHIDDIRTLYNGDICYPD